MPYCVVRHCKNSSAKHKNVMGFSFHKFPTKFSWKSAWINVVREMRNEEDWLPSKYSVVCSSHFEEHDLYYTKLGGRHIKKYAVPKMIQNTELVVCESMEQTDMDSESPTPYIKVEVKTELIEFEEIEPTGDSPETSTPALNTEQSHRMAIQSNTTEESPKQEPTNNSSMSWNNNIKSEQEVDHSDSDLDSVYDSPHKSKLRKQARTYKERCKAKVKKIKILHQQIRRLKKRNAALKVAIDNLKEKTTAKRQSGLRNEGSVQSTDAEESEGV